MSRMESEQEKAASEMGARAEEGEEEREAGEERNFSEACVSLAVAEVILSVCSPRNAAASLRFQV